jgi:hypothetical protein
MMRSWRGEPKPLRMIEGWSKLSDNNLTDGYIRFSHPVLDKPIVWKTASGQIMLLKGDVGIRQELFPYVEAYFKSSNYTTYDKLATVVKSVRMAGGFHIGSLTMQSIAGGKGLSRLPVYNVVEGMKLIKEMSPELRKLHKAGAQILERYEDIAAGYDMLEKAGLVGLPIKELRDLTFKVVHRGMYAKVSYDIFQDFKGRQVFKLGRALTEAEETMVARKTVSYTNQLFSGEDYRHALLQSTEWMAKNWYNPEARKNWQRFFLAPSWQKVHISMAKNILTSVTTKISEPDAYLYRRYLYGALSIYGAANLYNYVMTKYMDGEGKFMWQNKSAFTVRAPFNYPDDTPAYLRPLKSIFEVPDFFDDPLGKVINKLAPFPSAIIKGIVSRAKGELPKKIVGQAIQDVALPISTTRIFEPNASLGTRVSTLMGVPTSKGYTPGDALRDIEKERAIEHDWKDKFFDNIHDGKSISSDDFSKMFKYGLIDNKGKLTREFDLWLTLDKDQRTFMMLPEGDAIKLFNEMSPKQRTKYLQLMENKINNSK